MMSAADRAALDLQVCLKCLGRRLSRLIENVVAAVAAASQRGTYTGGSMKQVQYIMKMWERLNHTAEASV